jgi:hypothetical protein
MFETLVPFRVLPLRLDAAIPVPETSSKIFNRNAVKGHQRAFPFKILDNFSGIGSGAGIAASGRRGSTLKGTKVSNLYKYFK